MHRFANPARFSAFARWVTPLMLVSGVVITLPALAWGLLYAPADQLQGDTVRILYLHVPAAWLGMLGWAGIAAMSLAELVWRHPLAGVAARAIALPGAVFTALCLATGSLWGRPAWGAWWVWDGRLTAMLVLLFLYCGYMALARATAGEASASSRVTAIFALVAAINLPIIHYSVIWWNTLHQPPSISLKGSAMAPAFLWPLLASMLGFTLIFKGVVLLRMRTELATRRTEARLRRKAARQDALTPTGARF